MQNINKLLARLWSQMSSGRKHEFILLVFMMIFAAILELISIGSIIPLITAITNPEKIINLPILRGLVEFLKINNQVDLLGYAAILFGILAIISGIFRLSVLYFNSRFSYSTGAELGLLIYSKTINQSYSYHLSHNSSEVISGIMIKISSVISVISMSLNFFTNLIIIISVATFIFILNPTITIFSFLGFGIIYTLIILGTRKRISQSSQDISQEYIESVKVIQESLGGIRDIIIDGNQDLYCTIYKESSSRLRTAQSQVTFLSSGPKYIVEALGLCLIAGIAFFLAKSSQKLSDVISILGVIVFASQRLLPLLQQIYSNYTVIKGDQASLEDALDFMDLDVNNITNAPNKTIQFERSIKFSSVCFAYEKDAPPVLEKVSYEVKKGSCIGVIGDTGSGKSTLLDVLMGLLIPSEGWLEIDKNKIDFSNVAAWQKHIAHVPQNIFLADTSIEENIAFGVPRQDIDRSRLLMAVKNTQLETFIESLPMGYQSFVGERGVKLSGGQRQRIGIARALYKNADVLILDEATSALDGETEKLVMKSIDSLDSNLTIFMVAHRVTSLSACDSIIEIKNGKLIREIKYESLSI